MIDIETLGNDHSTTVVSVGVVCFNNTGIISKKLFVLDFIEQLKRGRSVTGSTLQWWMGQGDSARAVFKDDPKKPKLSIEAFLTGLDSFLDESLKKVGEKRDELKPWGNGANFDITIIEDFYRSYHPKHEFGIPWKFWNVWCFRTFNHLTKAKDKFKREGIHHDALDDAEYQANCVLNYWKTKSAAKAKGKTK